MIDQPQASVGLPLADLKVGIAGARSFKNELISYFLDQQGGARCQSTDDPAKLAELALAADGLDVALWDVMGLGKDSVLSIIEQYGLAEICPLVLVDVREKAGLEREALKAGVKGFFYIGEPLGQFLKGMQLVCQGELWVPRAVMQRCLMEDTQAPDARPRRAAHELTSREREVLEMIAGGARNADIAHRLDISPHTVKAHVYNAFKKIGVSNRVQAARWAAENLTAA